MNFKNFLKFAKLVFSIYGANDILNDSSDRQEIIRHYVIMHNSLSFQKKWWEGLALWQITMEIQLKHGTVPY